MVRVLHPVISSLLAATAVMALSGAATAAPLANADILADWGTGPDPLTRATEGVWTLDGGGNLTGTANHRGVIVSDFTAVGTFRFFAEHNPGDNDSFGMVFGWTDIDNHYRVSWSDDYGESSANPFSLANGRPGFRVIKMVGGTRTVLYTSGTDYSASNNYSLEINGLAGGFSVTARNETISAVLENEIINDSTFASGKVGLFHTYQQSSDWYDVDFTQGQVTPQVPLPAALPLLGAGLGLLAFAGRRRERA